MRLTLHYCLLVWLLSLAKALPRKDNAENYRLPTNTIPSHYSLDLQVNPENTTFDGLVEITIATTNADNDQIKLHASPKFITIKSVLLDKAVCNVTDSNEVTEIVTLACPKGSVNGERNLTIEYVGLFSTEDMNGFYKSTYEDDGEKFVLVATQFESTYARRAFPCFDEPGFKATFDVSVSYPNTYIVLANTPANGTLNVSKDYIQTDFETTPKMSTYLVALVVSKFEANKYTAEENYEYKVYARPNAKDFTSVAAKYGATLIDIMSDFTGIKYEDLGNKQAYQVAIPDFSAGAMENWGLITYREVELLDEGNKTSPVSKQRIITTIAHELSHQWFGDYVTLNWWSSTWLNEGFATYFEYHNPDKIPDENLELSKQFVTDVLQHALQTDAVPSSQPLTSPESEINSPAEDDYKFDDISYYKGSSIIRMMDGIMGEKKFKEALHMYLNKYQYRNTNPDLLLEVLEATNNITDYNVTKVLENWIYKSGFPLITASINDNGTVVLTQERFTTVQSPNNTDETQWYVPISYTTSDEKDFTIKIKKIFEPNATCEVEINDGSWIIFNVQQSGFYRVNYDDTLWDRIIEELKGKDRDDIDVLNRAQLVDDAFNLARVGKLNYERTFELADFLNSETEYYPWASALSAVSYLSGKLGDDKTESMLETVTLGWINNAFPNGTNTGYSHIDFIKEAVILDWACKLGQEECIDYALKTFAEYKKSSSLPDYNKRGIVFCYALRHSENPDEDYDFLFNVFKQSISPVEQNVIIASLGCASNSSILQRYLSETISTNSSIRRQDAILVFRAVYRSSALGVDVALKFLEDNLKKISEVYNGLGALTDLAVGLANKLSTDDDISRLKKLIKDHPEIEDLQVVNQQVIDITTANKAWTEAHGDQIKGVLEKKVSGDANISKPCVILAILSLATLYISTFT